MKLYYSPGACSLAPHIALAEAGIPADIVRVDLRTHKLPDGSDYHKVNPKGYVPAVQLEDGTVLTEVSILLQYIADRKPGKAVAVALHKHRVFVRTWDMDLPPSVHRPIQGLKSDDKHPQNHKW